MTSTSHSLEHSFRHEYGRLVSVLAKRYGMQQIDAIEDAVQGAMLRALNVWGRQGLPSQPAAWLYRVSQNLLLDHLRREHRERERAERISSEHDNRTEEIAKPLDLPDAIEDESLRLLFLCCHPELPLESRVAFALKVVSGFSTQELANSFLISHASAEKRVARAKEKLRSCGAELAILDTDALTQRLDSVLATLYLLFNEGYSSSHGDHDLRRDLCDEAIRLARMLAAFQGTTQPSTLALLALMLMHRARMDARQGHDGSIVTLEEQDRTRWNWQLIREAMDWMKLSAIGDSLSRYHLESAITWEHCRVSSVDEVDWTSIEMLYQHLHEITPTPMVKLNWAIAKSYATGPDSGLEELSSMVALDRAKIRPWWDCAMAQVYHRMGKHEAAIGHWRDAEALAGNQAQRDLIKRRIVECGRNT